MDPKKRNIVLAPFLTFPTIFDVTLGGLRAGEAVWLSDHIERCRHTDITYTVLPPVSTY
jgi:hypothetical protein